MINNISVWTGESGQQIPQTGLVMIQQQNNANSGGNSEFFMNSAPSMDNLASIGIRPDNPMGVPNTSTFQPNIKSNATANTRGATTTGSDLDQPSADGSTGNGLEMLGNWNSYPGDDVWSGRGDLGFLP